jgi:hypothetical protein
MAVFDGCCLVKYAPFEVDLVAEVAVADDEIFAGSRKSWQEADPCGEEAAMSEEEASVDGREV